MHKSTDRILTTHAGSIPRGEPLGAMLIDEEAGKPVDKGALQSNIDLRVSHVLAKQAEAGIDVVNDGEQGARWVSNLCHSTDERLWRGLEAALCREFIEYPQFTQRMMERLAKISKVFDAPEAIADVQYRDTALINAEIDRLTRLGAAVRPRVTEFFMNAPSPGIVATTMLNAHYASHEAYLDAVAREIRTEYLAVTKAGFALQIDAPDLAMERVLLFQDMSDIEYATLVEQHVAALTRRSRASRQTACGCMSAGETGKARTCTTWRWRSSCRRSIRRMWVRWVSNSPIRAVSTKWRRCTSTSCPTA
jgi:5-methyltetrahydropteroyltriglutamate--homocysteine methyltransferase